MKLSLALILFLAFVSFMTASVAAESTDAAQDAAQLRTQLLDVQAKEDALQAHLRQLDEDLKPENIERSLAGVGSTRPEELREQRRRQLTIEREGVNRQLGLLATSHQRLEAALRTADAAAYQQSAEGYATPLNQAVFGQGMFGSHWAAGILAGLFAVFGITVVTLLWRRMAKQ